MHIHILGICGAFMGGIALLARAMGHTVSGSDANVYPPMSTQLEAQGINILEGYQAGHLQPAPDMVVIGNALSRGNPAVEYVLEQGLPYTSGPQWLGEQVLPGRWVLAVAGTHGKTTTASILAWLLEANGLAPGFLIGGVPNNFGVSARLGETPFFVVEADEYDSAFFDKRSKFIHYRPRTLVLNNLEFDHADIFPDLEAIKIQFHHLIRTVPANGLIITPDGDDNLDDVLQRGCWTPLEYFSATEQGRNWTVRSCSEDDRHFYVDFSGDPQGEVNWSMMGRHNMHNGLAAVAAARHAGVPSILALQSLTEFTGIKRRMEVRGEVAGITVYDDFAHHPTAIATTIQGLRKRMGDARILAVLEPRSNTMRMGLHADTLANALSGAQQVFIFRPEGLDWDITSAMQGLGERVQVFTTVDEIIQAVVSQSQSGDHVLIMSNGSFENIHQRLLTTLQHKHGVTEQKSA